MEEPSVEPKESSPANLVALKTAATSLRDQILRAEKEDEAKGRPAASVAAKNAEKPRKKLAEVEAQLLLASPNLVFQVSPRLRPMENCSSRRTEFVASSGTTCLRRSRSRRSRA